MQWNGSEVLARAKYFTAVRFLIILSTKICSFSSSIDSRVPFRRILIQPSALFSSLTLGQLASHEIGVIRRIKSNAEKTCKMERKFARIVKTLVSPNATFYKGNLKFRFQRRGFYITRVDSRAHMSSDSRFSHHSSIFITQFRILKTRIPDLTIKSIVSSGTKWK